MVIARRPISLALPTSESCNRSNMCCIHNDDEFGEKRKTLKPGVNQSALKCILPVKHAFSFATTLQRAAPSPGSSHDGTFCDLLGRWSSWYLYSCIGAVTWSWRRAWRLPPPSKTKLAAKGPRVLYIFLFPHATIEHP